jgi:hemerythrin-like domain-containing protein
MGKATQDLRSEHDSILHVFHIMDRAFSSSAQNDAALLNFGKELVYFLKKFADQCHHGKEENYFFAELAAHGMPAESGQIAVLLAEHRQGREAIARMSQALESGDVANFKSAAVGYRDLLRSHIDKENNDLFVKADTLLGDEAQAELAEKFESFEEGVIGHGIHEQLHAMIDQWAEQFGGK